MLKAYKTELLLSKKQQEKIKQTIGVCRYVYNLYLHTAQEHYGKKKKYLSGYDFSKWLNNVHTKEKDFWIKNVSSKAVKQSIMNGDKAFRNFFKGLSGFPSFKKKRSQDVKAYFVGTLKVKRHRLWIPTIGWVRLKELGYIPTNRKIKSLTVSQNADRFFVSVLCEVEENKIQLPMHDGVGIDLGVITFVTCSHHEVFKGINKTQKIVKLEKKLKREQRKLSRKIEQNKKRKRGENCYKNRQKQQLVVQKLHARLSNIRKEYTRYVVSTLVKTKPTYITIEDLNVKGMMKNRHLSKVVAQQNFYYFREWLQFKCVEYGIELRMVNRWYPSSKLCSNCRFKKVELSLADRKFCCDNCSSILDRDFNASLNLKYAKEYTVLT